MNLVFLGAAASGKGTQAKKLEGEFGVTQISTGDLLRDAVRNGTELGKQADPLMKQGRLVPDALVISLIEERFKGPKMPGGFLLDGFPRTLPQAEALDTMLERNGLKLDRVLSLEVPEEVLYERVEGRRSCPKDGTAYHLIYNPPKREGFCDVCGTGLIQRSDDTKEKLKNRIDVFKTEVPKVKAHYGKLGLLSEIKGVGSPDGIFADVKKAVGSK